MGHIRVKTKYTRENAYGVDEEFTLYADHSSITDTVTFYDEQGDFLFCVDESRNNMVEAINRLYFIHDKDGKRKEGLEYYNSVTDPQIK